MTTLTSTP
jgi:hypothetical protein